MKAKQFFSMPAMLLLAGAMSMTSCEDILGEWDRPTPQAPGVKYYVYNADGTKTEAVTPSDAITWTGTIAAGDVAAGTYIVEGNVTCDGKLTLKGQVNLILKDGAKLTVSDGINHFSGGSLTIYGQSDDEATMGQLVVNSSLEGIYVNNLTIHGGKITASGFSYYEAIHSYAAMTVYAGIVDATSPDGSAILIGGNGPLTVHGGKITATSNTTNLNRAGIYSYSDIVINGGKVTTAGVHAIYANGKNLEIYGGTHDLTSNAESLSANTITFAGGTISITGCASGSGATNGVIRDGNVVIKTTIEKMTITNSNVSTENVMQYWINPADANTVTFGTNAAIVGSTWNTTTIADNTSIDTYTGFTVSRGTGTEGTKTLTIIPN